MAPSARPKSGWCVEHVDLEKGALLVVHEIFGLTDWVRGICDQLAENGVIAIAPDLLSGETYSDVDGRRAFFLSAPGKQRTL